MRGRLTCNKSLVLTLLSKAILKQALMLGALEFQISLSKENVSLVGTDLREKTTVESRFQIFMSRLENKREKN